MTNSDATIPVITMTKVLGNLPYIYKFCHDLGLVQIVDELVPSARRSNDGPTNGELLAALVVNRLLCPRPLYQIDVWAQQTGFEFLIPGRAKVLNDDRLGRLLDTLDPHLEQIQETFVLHVMTTFQIDPKIIHYDITSLYFEGEYAEVDWITLGYSRDNKPDRVQCNVALNTTDGEAFPALWRHLPGNTNDTKTVIQNLQQLKKRFPKTKVLHIGDRAMFSKEIYEQALQWDLDILAPLKTLKVVQQVIEALHPEDLEEVIHKKDRKTVAYRLGETSLQLDAKGRLPPLRAVIVWSAAQAQAAANRQEQKILRRRQALQELQGKLNHPYYTQKKTIEQKLKRIMKSDPVNDGFQINLQGTDGQLMLEVQEEPSVWKKALEHAGLYLIGTTLSPDEYSSIDVFRLYKRQYKVERRIRTLKQTIKVRPLFVQREERIRGLLFISMLALSLYSLIEVILSRGGVVLTGRRFFQQLSGMVLVQLRLPDQSLMFQISPPSPAEQSLLTVLNWSEVPPWTLNRVNRWFRGLGPPTSASFPP